MSLASSRALRCLRPTSTRASLSVSGFSNVQARTACLVVAVLAVAGLVVAGLAMAGLVGAAAWDGVTSASKVAAMTTAIAAAAAHTATPRAGVRAGARKLLDGENGAAGQVSCVVSRVNHLHRRQCVACISDKWCAEINCVSKRLQLIRISGHTA